MAMGECLTYGSLPANSKVNFAAFPTNWRPPGAAHIHSSDPSELSQWLCHRWSIDQSINQSISQWFL